MTPLFDEHTLLWLLVTLPSLMAMVAAAVRTSLPDGMPGLSAVGLGLCWTSAGYFVLAAMPPDPTLRPLFTNLLMVSGFTLLLQGWFQLLEVRVPRRWLWAQAAITYAIGAWMTGTPDWAPWRIGLLTGMQALLLVIALAITTTILRRLPIAGGVGAIGFLALLLAAIIRLTALANGETQQWQMATGSLTLIPLMLFLQLTGFILVGIGGMLVALQRVRETLQYLATHDALTGLLTRSGFTVVVDRLLPALKRRKAGLAFLIADIDHFKQVNDQQGHQAGDIVLREVADRLRACLRGEDALARFGGEEFVCLLPATDAAGARIVAERIRADVAAMPFVIAAGRSLSVTVSLGIATSDDAAQPIDALYRQADAALYRAKAAGRNRVEVINATQPDASPA